MLRDVAMLSAGLLDSKLRETPVPSNIWGKLHAGLAFLAIGLAIGEAANLFFSGWVSHAIWSALLVTVSITSVVYCAAWRRIHVLGSS